MDRDRQTATLNCEISIMWKTKPRTTSQNASRLLMGIEQVTMPKPCKLYDDDDDDDDDNNDDNDDKSTYSTSFVFFFWGGGFPPHNLNNERSIIKVKNY